MIWLLDYLASINWVAVIIPILISTAITRYWINKDKERTRTINTQNALLLWRNLIEADYLWLESYVEGAAKRNTPLTTTIGAILAPSCLNATISDYLLIGNANMQLSHEILLHLQQRENFTNALNHGVQAYNLDFLVRFLDNCLFLLQDIEAAYIKMYGSFPANVPSYSQKPKPSERHAKLYESLTTSS